MKSSIVYFLISFAVALVLAPMIIALLRRVKAGQEILKYVDWHKSKSGTPTMGGAIFILPILILSVFILRKSTPLCTIAVVSALAYGVLGFLDDYLKIKTHKNLGLRAYQKIIGQGGIALLVSVFYYIYNRAGTVVVPFANVTIDLGFWILPFTFLLFIATTNAVNLTDGLDGLAGGVTAVYLAAFSLLAVLVSKSVVRVDELQAILNVVAVAIGALLCYLLFNSNRATVFMGDTGSLFLGGFVAAVSLFCYMPLFVLVLGAMYVLSALSVIIQVAYFKFSGGKRVFLMAPFHHHLEKHGWGEARIVALYCIVTAVVAAVCVVCLI